MLKYQKFTIGSNSHKEVMEIQKVLITILECLQGKRCYYCALLSKKNLQNNL